MLKRYRREIGVPEFRTMVASRFSALLPPAADQMATIEWGQHYLPHYYVNRPSRMHLWLGRHIDRHYDKRGRRTAVVGPRSGAKSVVGNLTTTLKRACAGRESYIIISSDTVTQAVEHIRSIKDELENNVTLALAYPEATGVGPIWQDKYIQMRNGTVIRAVGTLSRIRGLRKRQHRPSLIIVDDPENDEHITSQRMRDRVSTWFKRTLLPMGDFRTNILVMGTAIHRECLVMSLLRTPSWRAFRDESDRPAPFKAIVRWPTRMDLWSRWEKLFHNVDNPAAEREARRFYLQNREAMHEGCRLLWPDREGLYYLMVMRAEMGHQAFEAEKQSNPINPDTCEWPEEYFAGEDLWFDKWPAAAEQAVRVVALDPSKGKQSRTGDYSAFAKLVVDHRGIFYFDIDMERRSTDKIVAEGVPLLKRFRPHKFGCEANQFQELLAEEFEEALRAADVQVPIDKIDNRVHKNLRIRRLSPLLAQRRVRFRKGSTGTIRTVEQLRDFPNGDHDDGPDAMEMAARLAADIIGEPFTSNDGLGETLEVRYA